MIYIIVNCLNEKRIIRNNYDKYRDITIGLRYPGYLWLCVFCLLSLRVHKTILMDK